MATKTKYVARLDGEIVGTRTTARTYTHAVVAIETQASIDQDVRVAEREAEDCLVYADRFAAEGKQDYVDRENAAREQYLAKAASIRAERVAGAVHGVLSFNGSAALAQREADRWAKVSGWKCVVVAAEEV